ncbi:MAG: hypothetical protein HUU49_00295 [Candidatus Buchananbacteria bacterium]|nr:hypothetical protein [Candidatus Buchananbacteria bacterium]
MIIYIIPAIIIVVSLGAIIFMVFKKLPDLAMIDVETIAQEKETRVRNRIMAERLVRSSLNLKKNVGVLLKPVGEKVKEGSAKMYQKILELEKKTVSSKQPLKKIDLHQETQDKLAEASRLLKEGELEKAEEIGIEAIELDNQNLEAYELLVEIYIKSREYKKARETAKYLLKLFNQQKAADEGSLLRRRLANCYGDLGYVYELEHRYSYALTNYQKAVELEPNNPRFLDLLMKISIILKNKKLALEVFSSLEQADPENAKLPEIKEEINNLPETQNTEPEENAG